MSERLVVALGGNAIAGERGADPESQRIAVEGACEQIAELVAHGHDVVITHGNGPQVGNLLLKNDLARHVVPPVAARLVRGPDAGDARLPDRDRARGGARAGAGWSGWSATVITRVLVDADDPAFLTADQADRPLRDRGGGGGAHRGRRGVGGPRRTRLAACRRLARPAGDPRPRHDRRADRRRRDRGRRRRRRDPDGARGRDACAASRPCSTRTSPARCWRAP